MAKSEPLFSLPVGLPVDTVLQVAPTMLACAMSDFEADLWAGALQVWKTPVDDEKGKLLCGVKFQTGISALASASEKCLLAGLDDGDIQVRKLRPVPFDPDSILKNAEYHSPDHKFECN